MIRKYVLLGVVIAILPAWVYAAEYKPANLLIIEPDQRVEALVDSKVSSTFAVTTLYLRQVTPKVLRNFNFVLFSQLAPCGGFKENEIEQQLKGAGLDQFVHKAFVLHGHKCELDKVKFSDAFKKLFTDGAFILDRSACCGKDFEWDFDFNSFGQLLQYLPTQFHTGALPAFHEQKQPTPELQQKIDQFSGKLLRFNPALAREFIELIEQLQNK